MTYFTVRNHVVSRIAVCLIGFALAAPAWGQLTEIDNQALFLNQTGATVIALPAGGVVGTPSFGGLTLSAAAGSSLAGNNFSPLIEPTDFTLSGTENFNVSLDSPAFGFGFEMDEDPGVASTFTFTLFSGGAGGTQVGTFTFQRPANTLSFVGGVTETAFDYVEIREIVGNNDNDAFGTFAVTSTSGEFWTAGGSGIWDTGGNWTGGTVPISTDNVFITPSTTLTVTGPAAATTVASLTIDNQDLTNGGGAGATTVNLSTGALSITNGLVIGATATDSGTSLLDVGNGTLNVGGDTNIRTGGTLLVATGGTYAPAGIVNLEGGTLSLDSIGSITPDWSSGTLEITGAAGLTLPLSGPLGPSPVSIDAGKTLNVTNKLTNTGAAILNLDGGSISAGSMETFLSTFNVNSGSANVAGTYTNNGTTNINGGSLTVGSFDNSLGTLSHVGGTLTVDGGTFTPNLGTPSLTLNGISGGPTLELIDGAAASFTGDISVAPTNDGGLSVLSGADLSTTGNLLIGQSFGNSDSTTTFSGAGSTIDIGGNLLMGTGSANGSNARNLLVVADNAAPTIGGDTTLGGNSRVELTGGSITTDSWTRLGFSQFQHTGGALTVDGGAYGSGTSNLVFGAAGRPVVNLINGATHAGTNVDITNAEWHVLSGSTVTLATFQAFNNTGSGAATLIEVDGAGSSITTSGAVDIGRFGGDATLMITNGGSFSVTNSSFAIATEDNVTASVTVDGMNSSLSVAGSSGLFVGNEGQGTLSVTNGGQVSANILTVADSDINNANTPTSTMTVNGSDGVTPSTLNVTGASYIGGSTNENGGIGILNIQAGALYKSNGGLIGSGNGGGSDGDGTVNVTGAGSFWNSVANGSSDIFVGDRGHGELNVAAGGRFDADALFIGNESGSETAAMTVDGDDGLGTSSTVNARGTMRVGNGRKGTLSMTNGAVLNSSTTGNFEVLIGNNINTDGSSLLVDDSTWNHNGTARIAVGNDSDSSSDVASSLKIQNGGIVNAASSIMLVADLSGSTGNLVVDGEGSTLTVGRMLMGDNGAGTATISNGADLVIAAPGAQIGNLEISAFGGGTGTMTVTDPGSTVTVGDWLSVGDEGNANGTLNIENGASVSSTGHSYIARVSSSNTGVVTVQDLNMGDGSSGSTLNVGASLFLGGNASGGGGDATLNVETGGTVNVTGQLKLWDDGKVNLNGGTINAASLDLFDPAEAPQPVFIFNSGTFRFTGGQNLTPETLADLLGNNLGAAPTLSNDMTLAVVEEATLSAPLRLNGGTLSVGAVFNNDLSNLDWDEGLLSVTDDGVLIGSGGLFDDTLILNVEQTLSASEEIIVDTGSTFVALGGFAGTELFNSGDTIIADPENVGRSIDFPVTNNAGAAITLLDDIAFNALVSGAGNFFGPGTATFAGGFSPGNSPASVSFEGDVEVTSTNTLTMELFGTTPGSEHDQLAVEGAVALDGGLDLQPSGSYTDPVARGQRDQFELITATGVSGQFSSISYDGGALNPTFGPDGNGSFRSHQGGGLFRNLTYTAGGVQLTNLLALEGDTDGDADIDITDFNTLATNFDPGGANAPNAWTVGNFDGDNDVDITDFNNLATNFAPGGYDGATAAAAGDANPGEVDLIVDLATGEVVLDGNAAAISGLQVFSAGNSLLATDFTADVLQFVISTNTSTYAEGAFVNTGVDGQVSLGIMYDLLVDARDLTFEYTMIGQPTVQGSVAYIPEPASLALMGLGGLLVLRRRRSA